MIIIFIGLKADLVNSGFNAFNNGDKRTASTLWGKACDKGNISGCYNLGIMYDIGDGIKQNRKMAVSFYQRACDGKDISGCYNLALMYLNGEGVRQNKEIAKESFGKACDEGHDGGCKGYKILNEEGI